MADLNSKFIDAHCHLSDERVWPKASEWIESAKLAGIKRVCIGGLEPAEWARQLELKKTDPEFIRTSFGVHPWWIEKYTRAELEKILEQLAANAKNADAIGETGLDHFSKRDKARFPDQEFAFRFQLKLAVALKKPLVLHVVKAHEVALRIIQEEGAGHLPMQVHSFSGSGEIAKEWIKLGAFLSFNGTLLKPSADKLRETLRATPHSNLLFETDSPDQAWREDGRNEPQFVREIYKKASQVLDLTPTTLASIVAENFSRFE
jgi:TatD DNase family protein